MEGVVSVFPNKKLQLQTTASWDFMGLKEGKNTKRNLAVESDTIVGVSGGATLVERGAAAPDKTKYLSKSLSN